MSGVGSVPPPPPPPPSSQTATQSQTQANQSQQAPQGAAAATGQVQTAQAVAQSQAAAKSAAISLSPSLAGLTPGQQLTGTVAQLQAGGLATLQTPTATYTLQTTPPLPLDSELKLQILSTGNALRAQVLSVNGLPPSLLQNASVNLTLTSLGGGTEGGARAQAEVSRAVQGSTPGTALPAVKAGVQLQALVLNDGSAAAAAATQTSSAVAQTQSTGSTLPPGTRLMVQVAQVIPPQQQSTAAQAANPGLVRPQSTTLPSEIANAGSAAQRSMMGQVIAPGPDGQLIVRAGGGLIRLDAGGTLPIGTQLRLDVLSSTMPVRPATQAGALVGADPRLQGLQTLGGSWANLRSALEALQQTDPRAAQALAARLPGPNPMLVNNMIGFMGAAATGDARAWLGPTTTKALEKAGKSDLIDKLDGDLKTMGRMAQESQAGDWRAQIIPFYDGHEIQQIRMFMKRNRRKDKDGKEQPGSTRVLVDMSLTALGDMQIDGLIQQKRFDMIMRTRFPVTDTMRTDLLDIFVKSLELSGMTGGLQFMVQSDFPSGPPELLRPLQGKSGYLQV